MKKIRKIFDYWWMKFKFVLILYLKKIYKKKQHTSWTIKNLKLDFLITQLEVNTLKYMPLNSLRWQLIIFLNCSLKVIQTNFEKKINLHKLILTVLK